MLFGAKLTRCLLIVRPYIVNHIGLFVKGEIDQMFVDCPPGTGDVPLTVFQSLPIDGIIIVTSPQDLVSMIVAKAVKMDVDISNIFKSLDKMNPEATMLSENALSVVTDWIDTGSMALNAICSGSLYDGIPVGRVTGLVGPSGCGKTLIMMKIMANAQKKGIIPVIWDSEAAADRSIAESMGCDSSKIKTCKNQKAKTQ